MPQRSAGLMLFRRAEAVEILVVHPGGPFYARKDDGAWSIPKGLIEADESPEACARRELAEETGAVAPVGPLIDLGEVRLKSGKRVRGFAAEGDFDVAALRSNTFEMIWPPRSGQMQTFPEVDRALWCTPEEARRKLHPVQADFVDRLLAALR